MLRPGLSLRDLEQEGQVQKLAVACWAREVRVMAASRRHAALVRVDVTRREPLADTIKSPLPGYVPGDPDEDTTESIPVPTPPPGVNLADVPDPRAARASNLKTEPRSAPTSQPLHLRRSMRNPASTRATTPSHR